MKLICFPISSKKIALIGMISLGGFGLHAQKNLSLSEKNHTTLSIKEEAKGLPESSEYLMMNLAAADSLDQDGDGYMAIDECDDFNASVNPGMTEVPYNGLDDDCNPLTADDDLDGDGIILAYDKDDNDPSVQVAVAFNDCEKHCTPLLITKTK